MNATRLGSSTPVLLVIDAQHDYLQFTASHALVDRLRRRVEDCRARGIPVVHVWTTVRRSDARDMRMPHWQHADKWICVEGTPGHASPIAPLPGEAIVHKQFFSAFGSSAFGTPTLDDVLAALNVDTLWLAGVQLQSCVRATALDAYQRGFRVELLHDVIGTEDAVHAAITKRYLDARLADRDTLMHARDVSARIAASTRIAHAVQRVWRDTSLDARRELLRRVASRIDVESLAQLVSDAVRKPIAMARGEVTRALALVQLAGRDEPLELPCGATSRLRYQPRGVVAVITPYNNPVAIPLGRIAPALFYGNTVVWKPSPAASAVADAVAALFDPPGLVQVIHGGVHEAEALMSDAHVDAVVLTGSESAGTMAQVICAQRHVPLQAELGGNNAAIVCADADIDAAAAAVADGAFGFAGQRCTANRRVIVLRECRDAFLAALERVIPNPGLLISAAKRDEVAALVERTPGIIMQSPARDEPEHFPATVIAADDPSCEIVQEETFGPVLVVQTAQDFDHAMALCNGVRQGLVAALFSTSPDHQRQFLADAQAGILKLNRTTADADAEAPFGGWKTSGVGPPEHGRSNREVFTRTQAVYT